MSGRKEMWDKWKLTLTRDWNFMRFFRLGLGAMILVQAGQSAELFLGVLGGILVLQSLLNVGCCGAQGCGYPTRNGKTDQPASAEDDSFEEVSIPAKQQNKDK